MGKLDIIILILALLFTFIGYKKGIIKQILGLGAWVLGLIAAFSLCKTVANFLLDASFGQNIQASIQTWLESKGELFTISGAELTEDALQNALSSAGIPTFLHSLLINTIPTENIPTCSLSEFLSPKICFVAMICIAFIGIFLVVFILIKIIAHIFSGITKGSAIGILDGFIGGIWGLVKAILLVSIAMLLLSFIVTIPGIGENINAWIVEDMKLNEEVFGVAKLFYEDNPILWLISNYTSFGSVYLQR